MLTVDISLPEVEELHKLVEQGQEKGFLSYDEIVAGLEEVELTKEQIVTIEVLHQRGQSQSQTARILGVAEGTVRYQLRRARDGGADGRQKPSRVETLGLAEAVAHWWQVQAELLGDHRPPSVQVLYDFLRAEHGFDGSYKSVRKFVRARFGRPRIRPFRRVETPPGAQTQSDWG